MAGNEGTRDFMRVILAYFVPPVGVFLQVGLGTAFWINLILTFLMYVPGILHAVWVIASTQDDGTEDPNAMKTFIALILAGFLPPVAVFMRVGVGQALLNLLLCFFFMVPGILHAVWVITHASENETA